ncbi:MAG: helix-turn-helix domain-containing protein [Patescibacteria group bacterium]|nr:helix-turn-helix domain-containing protein [Patescibacteria group bacterium]
MRTIGVIIREARLSKKMTLADLSKLTKIKQDFIAKIEQEKWRELPEYTTVAGFVKRIAQCLELSEDRLVLTLRRDYSLDQKNLVPQKEIATGFIWQPKYTFFVLMAMTLAIFVAYIIFQYISFNSPPFLVIYKPVENEVIKSRYFVVEGKTTPDSTVRVNNQTAYVEKDGRFFTEIEVSTETKEVIIKSVSRAGKETTKKVIINVQE